jgi:hypothetical protein
MGLSADGYFLSFSLQNTKTIPITEFDRVDQGYEANTALTMRLRSYQQSLVWSHGIPLDSTKIASIGLSFLYGQNCKTAA